MLGGSSNLNYLFYVRGDAKDYDHWSDLGFPDWSYKKVLPYFLRSEKYVKKSKQDVRFAFLKFYEKFVKLNQSKAKLDKTTLI